MARCLFPESVLRQNWEVLPHLSKYIEVPCGKCPNCLKRRTASWLYRLETESLRWSHHYFLTLTYEDDLLPVSFNGYATLQPDDVTRFIKRLRKLVGDLCYYYCGEYGDKLQRPHYHVILFANADIKHHIENEWCEPNASSLAVKAAIPYATPQQLRSPYGHVHFGDVKPESITYTVQYFDKGTWRPSQDDDDRHPEFSRMSKSIGLNYLHWEAAHHLLDRPEKGYIYDNQGRKIPIPSFYKRRLYDYILPERLVLYHPSILLHLDYLSQLKDERIEAQQAQATPAAELTPKRRYAEAAYVANYQRSKQKRKDL